MKRLVVGNWKMNLSLGEAQLLAHAACRTAERLPQIDVVIAPSLPFLISIKDALRFTPPNFYLASQAVSPYSKGAYTGDVAAGQLTGVVSHVLVGHSERRRYHHESETVSAQIKQVLDAGMTPIVCFGEAKRNANVSPLLADLKRDVHGLDSQAIARCVFAYEPVWAIGTGVNATPSYIQTVVSRVLEWFQTELQETPMILYGGSINEDNADQIAAVKVVSGALVGGASLQGKSFDSICRSFASF